MMMHSFQADFAAPAEEVDIAHWRLLLEGRGSMKSAAAILNRLWAADGAPVSLDALLGLLPAGRSPRKTRVSNIWASIERLNRRIRQAGLPLRLLAGDGPAFCLERKDRSWSFRDPRRETAALLMASIPSLSPAGARVLGELWQNFGRPVPHDLLAKALASGPGKRISRSQIGVAVRDARTALCREGIDICIEAIQGFSFRLVTKTRGSLSWLFGEISRCPGDFGNERLAIACHFLGTSFVSAAAAFLLLWDRRNEVVAYETMVEEYERIVLSSGTRTALHMAVQQARTGARDQELGFHIRSHKGIGYQLQISVGTVARFSDQAVSLRSGLSFFDRRAQLATLLPTARASVLTVLQILRDMKGGEMDANMIASRYYDHLGEEISRHAVESAISRARGHLKSSEIPMTIARAYHGNGYALSGDVNGWLTGSASSGPSGRQAKGARAAVSVPVYRNPFERSRQGYGRS